MAASTILVDIVSDTICPFCFIGKRRLEAAIERFRSASSAHAEVQFDIRWHPFYLGPPDSPVMSKMQRYREKFGAARTEQMIPYMKSIGAKDGIAFSYEGPIGPTYLSHRVLQYVQEQERDRTDHTVEALFRSYFEASGNIFTKESLLHILQEAKVKLDWTKLETFLDDPSGREQIDREVLQAQMKRINGVPDFTINKEYHINGAQEVEVFVDIFDKIMKKQGQ
ncbi:protein of unknown function [Taphrina deformans PYCC 5710]|uniref:DSBA-like thioredoxin domain-containing protein n=1 Tax=Taphrina deformans (strain PYCC 5710 / ATCC 11124 / CBS 356.35 / IMI 108563 / JCM 9778 / NBRC 8474) TaxID=1097556 RepID=R4XNQ3_TAPDE|nr:protein of unknown function [Taphrina deformans PYCC 5710]|eukprot:CCG84876.1 protein of unknown function [Taphrina deformans PYCC 5710]